MVGQTFLSARVSTDPMADKNVCPTTLAESPKSSHYPGQSGMKPATGQYSSPGRREADRARVEGIARRPSSLFPLIGIVANIRQPRPPAGHVPTAVVLVLERP